MISSTIKKRTGKVSDPFVECTALCHSDKKIKVYGKKEVLSCTWCHGSGRIRESILRKIKLGLDARPERNGKRTSLEEGLRWWAQSGFKGKSWRDLLAVYARRCPDRTNRRWPTPEEALTWAIATLEVLG